MGLAPYGQPKYVDLILDDLVDLMKTVVPAQPATSTTSPA